MLDILEDTVTHPKHYEIYPVQPIEITRHLGFCLGNVVKYVLRAPYKGGVEDCIKATRYLQYQTDFPEMTLFSPVCALSASYDLINFLDCTPGDKLWRDIAEAQGDFLAVLIECLEYMGDDHRASWLMKKKRMEDCIFELRRVLSLRDTTGQIYEGLSGMPGEADNGHN